MNVYILSFISPYDNRIIGAYQTEALALAARDKEMKYYSEDKYESSKHYYDIDEVYYTYEGE